jgi:predicted metal-dependent HD superfamily phosphohydrolase
MLPIESTEAFRDSALEAIAEALYNPALPYHNFAHALSTLQSADRILVRCAEEGIEIRGLVVYYALLFHDAGYHENQNALGFASKEAYSAHLARVTLEARRVADDIITAVERSILATERGAKCLSVEDAVVRMADLSGLGGDYAIFLANTIALWDEVAMLYGRRVDWADWCGSTREVLAPYLSETIALTREFRQDEGGGFFARARENLRRLGSEPLPAR